MFNKTKAFKKPYGKFKIPLHLILLLGLFSQFLNKTQGTFPKLNLRN